MSDLDRFMEAQNNAFGGYATALGELRRGQKRSHWIWYVFPQVDGIGSSTVARRFAICDAEEAREYLRHDLLRRRLIEATEAVATHLRPVPPIPLATLMGAPIDAMKLVSSMTLFRAVAKDLLARGEDADLRVLAHLTDEVLTAAAQEGRPPCAHTLRWLGEQGVG